MDIQLTVNALSILPIYLLAYVVTVGALKWWQYRLDCKKEQKRIETEIRYSYLYK